MRRPRPSDAATAGSARPASHDHKRLDALRLRRQPHDQPSHHPHPGRRRLDHHRLAAVPDRRLRHRQNPPAHRLGHRRRRGRPPGPLRPGSQAGQRTRRSRRRTPAGQNHRPLRPPRPAVRRRTGLPGTWTGAAPNCCSRSSPNAKRKPPSPSPPTSRSPAGPAPSPTRDCAPRSSTGSPSTGTSSKPAPPATASPTPARTVNPTLAQRNPRPAAAAGSEPRWERSTIKRRRPVCGTDPHPERATSRTSCCRAASAPRRPPGGACGAGRLAIGHTGARHRQQVLAPASLLTRPNQRRGPL